MKPNNAKKIKLTAVSMDAHTVLLSISDTPKSILDMNNYIERSASKIANGKEVGNKVLPVGEVKIEFQLTLDDGQITTVSGTLPVWLNKEHIKSAESAMEAKLKADKEAELQSKRAEALSSLTPEQLQKLMDLGLLK